MDPVCSEPIFDAKVTRGKTSPAFYLGFLYFQSVLRMFILDPGSKFSIPDLNFFIPYPGSALKNFKYFSPKNVFKAPGNMIMVVHPGSGS
jgi:hypothetical protein